MAGKLYSIRLSEIEQKQISELKKEGIGITDIFRAGLGHLNIASKIIKVEKVEKVEKVKEETIKETLPEGQCNTFSTYGCGCAKEPGKTLCSKHRRT